MTTTTTTPDVRSVGSEHEADRQHRHRWIILAVIAVAQLMVVLDATIVNIALPSAQKALGFNDSDRQWVVTAYALAFGSLLLLGGRLGDLFGRRRTFLVGLVGFALASAVGGAAGSFTLLVTARAAQGMFAALLAPAALSLLTTTFTRPGERAKAFGIYGAIAGGGGAAGLLLGGILTEYLSWRWCLYVNLLFAAIAVVGGIVFLGKEARTTVRPKLDVPGTIAVSAGLFSLVYGFSKAETAGWSDAWTIGFLTAGVALLAIFAWLENRVTHPLLPLRIVLDRNRGGSFIGLLASGAGLFGVFLFLTYYLQGTLGYSPIATGLAFLPMLGALMLTASVLSAALLPRVGPRPLVPTGLLIGAAGMVMLTQLGLTSTYTGHILPALLVVGFGLGLVVAPSMNTATAGIKAADAGVASAAVNTSQQVGGSIGVALLSTLAASAATSYLSGRRPTADALATATLHSYTTAFWWAAAIFAVGGVICALLFRNGAVAPASSDQPAFAH